MSKTRIRLDSNVLEPWREVADVLGLSMPAFLEQLISYFGKFHNEREIMLDEQVTQAVYATQAEAAAVASRFEQFAVQGQLDGHKYAHAIVAEPVATQDSRWSIQTDHLGPNGWILQDDEGWNEGEEWKDEQP
jgi:hypothetical protein